MPESGLHARRRERRRGRRRWLAPCAAAVLLAAACGRFGFESLPIDASPAPDAGQLDHSPSLACNLGTVTDCSACGDACADQSLPGVAEFACVSAVCAIASCAPNYADCDQDPRNGCETSLETLENCGGCDVPCAIPNAEASCAGGTCQLAQCAAGFGNCDGDIAMNGCERELNTLTNCGGCGVPCALANGTTSCDTGTCQLLSCDNGFDDCDGDVSTGCETALDTLANCGSCRALCDIPGGQDSNCSGGVCSAASCAPFRADCDGDGTSCETDLRTLSDCVSCGVGCGDANGRLPNATASCASGSCGIGSCDPGWDDCDGSPGNGCETRLDTLLDCGGCDVACVRANATESCASGACQIVSCDAGRQNCDGIDSNGCEALLGSNQHCSACNDSCGANQTCSSGSCIGAFNTFQPANVNTGALNPATAPDVLLDCGSVTLDTSSLSASGWCGRPAPPRVVQKQTNGPDLVVVSMKSLQIAAGTSFRVSGSRPVALVVFGDVDISGTLDVSASGSSGGPGQHWNCDPPGTSSDSVGTNGGDTSSDGQPNGGGGGGGFGARGGRGGNGGSGFPVEQGGGGGVARGSAALTPLIPGCNGGWGGGCGQAPGGGGGSVELAATGRIDIAGSVLANGGNGRTGCDSSGGATGGGSGGGILIQGERVFLNGGNLLAEGGAGGRGAGVNGGNGGPGGTSGAGQDGSSGSKAGGGGGGGTGRIRVTATVSCSLAGSVSPPASTSCP